MFEYKFYSLKKINTTAVSLLWRELEGKVVSPQGELSAGKAGLELKHDGAIKKFNDGPSGKIGKDRGSLSSNDEVEIGGYIGIAGVNYKYNCN